MAHDPDLSADLPPDRSPDSLVVTTDTGDQIHYLDWRAPAETNGLPPLLLIHGLSATAGVWAPIARRLAAQTHLLAVDLRGHGLSDSPRSGYELESLAYDALTVLSANGYGTAVGGPPSAVAGHGLGAMVAATMAALEGPSVAAIALVDGGWEDLREATGQEPAEFERTIGDPPEITRSMDAYLADRREFDPATWDAEQERAARAAVDEKPAGHVVAVLRRHASHATVESMFDYRPTDTLTQIKAPVLAAIAEAGTADDETVRERLLALDDINRDRAAAGLPAVDIRRFPGVGHNLMRYRPAELSAALLELLRLAQRHQRS
ncbi:MAG TPA: alpha/beta hydrolase [Candidatus Limnocylindrales bacterium]|nr:alpha/beta hydrolase [Candidatus Limnocylindrales bacterium]